ncbi:FAD/NAD(P)-binding protein [Actinokineospora auranticolor]|uniref:FAD-NAD(P)-binding protein n=1 Tax=Actinokineospora auranticolor TaxID=155976 RepID=A0A2S6GT60_9PSEU|nr:FAD/NAD(P)-binding protein [Actinokineospora auranticolor]PPK68379.1 FAD-NAD(P)-binding protein [Actinokineospora auranticolor]
MPVPTPPRRICVVGAGPRGLSVVERLCANAVEPLHVHLVDPHAGSGGRVWSVRQPPSLLMNTVASQVSMFTDPSVDCAGPIVPGPSLYEWAREVTEPAWVVAEARSLTPNTYPTRAFYGHYLDWVLARVCRSAPVFLHRRTAVALDESPDGSQVVTLDDGTVLDGLAAVVLAQGHVEMPVLGDLAEFAEERGLGYWPPANPAEVDLSPIMPGEPIAVRGMGLAFFDHLALLTTDRGGQFKERSDGSLAYVPSGREPLIIAGSRRGVPYHARGENEKGVYGRHEPVFLTPSVIASLRARSGVSFRDDIWPLVAREVELVYYRTLLGERGAEFEARFLAGEPDLPARFGVAPWDWERIAYPHEGRRFASVAEFSSWLLRLLRDDVDAALGGNVSDPVKAALDVLRDLRNEIRLAVDHGGVTGSSYRADLDRWYTPLNAYLSIGPPARRVAELVALIEADVVRVVGPGMRVDRGERGFLVSSPVVAGSGVWVSTLVEARVPEVDIRTTTDPLISYLRDRGECAPYRMPDPSGAVETGGLAVTERPYHLIDAGGNPHRRRFAYGVPTESVHWVTAAGIRPGVNSVILADADAIARAALAVEAVACLPAEAVARPA